MTDPGSPFAVPAMPSDEDVEKRAYRRLPRTYPVTLAKLDFPMPKKGMYATCCDISTGGICVEAAAAAFAAHFAVGDTCRITVTIPMLNKFSRSFFKVYENDAEQYFTALGDISWVKPMPGQFLVGFRFVNVHSDQLTALENLIERAFAGD